MNPDHPQTPAAPVAASRLAGFTPPAQRPDNLPNWLKTVPFVALHLALVAVFFVDLSWQVVLLCFATYFWRMFGVTGGYHRYFAHRSYKTSRAFQFVLAWLGCAALQKGPLWWAGHHREHHHYSDTPNDPHSPHETTFWWSHVGWILSEEHADTPEGAIQDSANRGFFRWEIDVSCYALCGLRCFGLVWGLRVPGEKALAHKLIQQEATPAPAEAPIRGQSIRNASPAVGWVDSPQLAART